MNYPFGKKGLDISPFMVMEVLERAKQLEQAGHDVIHMEVGEPDFDMPACAEAATIKALSEHHTHYTHSLGDIELREEIVALYKKKYGVEICSNQIIITSGSSPAILLALSVLLDKNDEVIHSDPGYACYANFINYCGGKAIGVPVHEQDGFHYRPNKIKQYISAKTKGIFVNSPMNPTGNLISSESLKMLSTLDRFILSDEIYHGLTYGKQAHTILEFTNKAFVFSGFSKLFAMTGLRLGYAIVPGEFIRSMQVLQQNLFISANSLAQRAGISVLRNAWDDVENMRRTYDERRRYMLGRLKGMGFKFATEPEGAFYIFVDARHICSDSYKLAFDILEKIHVGVTPGVDFGPNGEGYLRFSYANSIQNIRTGMDRLETYLKHYKSPA